MLLRTQMLMLSAFASALLVAGPAFAAVSPDEAKQLGGEKLLVWGAEKAGNKEGTIPPYTGTDRPKPPPSWNPKEPGNMPDPYSNEKPLFVITSQNYEKYANTLTEGQKALFKRYPNYRMDVYPTHRTSAHSPFVLENTLKNATACQTASEGVKLVGCYGGFPFPIPKTGNEAVWNHIMTAPAWTWGGFVKTYTTDSSGKVVLQGHYDVVDDAPWLNPANKNVLPNKSVYWRIRFDAIAPARKYGEKYIIIDSLDALDPGRRVWSYIPGQRRVKLAPDIAYDTPSPASGGSSTMDENRLFMGAQDRYDFKLLGKKEVFMMYNSFKFSDYRVCPDQVSRIKNFLNPDCIRWELHRAWVVQATLKPGFRHVLPKRMLYFDEDSHSAGVADSWDAANQIYRIDNMVSMVYYWLPYGQTSDYTVTYDLQTGIVSDAAGIGFPGSGYNPMSPASDKIFSPEGMAGEGVR